MMLIIEMAMDVRFKSMSVCVLFLVVESVRPVPCFFNIKYVCPSYGH